MKYITFAYLEQLLDIYIEKVPSTGNKEFDSKRKEYLHNFYHFIALANTSNETTIYNKDVILKGGENL